MGKSFQTQFGKKLYKWQNKMQSFQVKISGTEVHSMLLNIVEDKYGNTQQTIINSRPLTVVFDFPNDEVPINLSNTNDSGSTQSSNTLHLYDILPITVHLKNEDIKDIKVTKGMLLLYPIKLLDDNVSITTFQITDCVAKGNPNYGILWQEFTVAPITDYALNNSEEYQKILSAYIQTLTDF